MYSRKLDDITSLIGLDTIPNFTVRFDFHTALEKAKFDIEIGLI